jgi:hypothetical protein
MIHPGEDSSAVKAAGVSLKSSWVLMMALMLFVWL